MITFILDSLLNCVEEAEKKRIAEEKKRKEKELDKNKTVVSKDVKSKDIKSKDKIVTKKEVETEDYRLDLSTSKFSSFSELKGNLNWPITKGKVVRKFGESLNPNLKTVTVNYGIDIKASGDLSVKNVAEIKPPITTTTQFRKKFAPNQQISLYYY